MNSSQKNFAEMLKNTQSENDMIIIDKPNARYVFPINYKKNIIEDASKCISQHKIPKSYLSNTYQLCYLWCTQQNKEYLLKYSENIKLYIEIAKQISDLQKMYFSHNTEMTFKEYEVKEKILTHRLDNIQNELPTGHSIFLLDLIESNFLK